MKAVYFADFGYTFVYKIYPGHWFKVTIVYYSRRLFVHCTAVLQMSWVYDMRVKFREKPENRLFGVYLLIFNRCQKFRNNSSNGICFSYVYIRMYTRASLARVRHSKINIETFSITIAGIGTIEIRNNNLRMKASSNGICVVTFKFGCLPVPQTGKHPNINVKTQIPLELDL